MRILWLGNTDHIRIQIWWHTQESVFANRCSTGPAHVCDLKDSMRKNKTRDRTTDDFHRWANELTRELDTEDLRKNSAPSTKIYAVVTITDIGRPQQGDVAFAISATKFKGYTGSAWVDFH